MEGSKRHISICKVNKPAGCTLVVMPSSIRLEGRGEEKDGQARTECIHLCKLVYIRKGGGPPVANSAVKGRTGRRRRRREELCRTIRGFLPGKQTWVPLYSLPCSFFLTPRKSKRSTGTIHHWNISFSPLMFYLFIYIFIFMGLARKRQRGRRKEERKGKKTHTITYRHMMSRSNATLAAEVYGTTHLELLPSHDGQTLPQIYTVSKLPI